MEVIGSIYTEVSDNFQRRILSGCIARCVKAESHDLGVVLMNEVKRLDNLYGEDRGTGFAGNVYDKDCIASSLTTMQGDMREPMIVETKCVGGLGEKKSNNGTQYYQQERVYQMGEYSLCLPANLPGGSYNYITDEKVCVAMRGRNPTNPSDRTPGIELEQTLEVNNNGTSNCLTSAQKDNLVLEKPNQLGFMDNGTGQHQSNTVYDEKALCHNITTVNGGGTQQIKVATQYRIRKLTPKECWRLMDFSDEDFEKAEKVNSNTQLYKQAGNSIVVNVLVAILGQLLQGKEDLYKEIS
jgi:DNA (cytosine-5)-methyltransferase 1